MKVKAIHTVNPENTTRAYCGRKLRTIQWRTDPADATCNTCVKIHQLRIRFGS